MTPVLMILAAVAASAPEPDRERLPPQPVEAPRIRDLAPAVPAPAIFTYAVDEACRIVRPRKLQGPASMVWDDAQKARDVFSEETVWRFVDGVRRQLQERRVKLLGEMILEGELVCHVLPSGEVVEAWIERTEGAVRRQARSREVLTIRGGRIEDLGTFSLDFQPDPPAP